MQYGFAMSALQRTLHLHIVNEIGEDIVSFICQGYPLHLHSSTCNAGGATAAKTNQFTRE